MVVGVSLFRNQVESEYKTTRTHNTAINGLRLVRGQFGLREESVSHSHPPVNPARCRPVAMYGHFRINCHTRPER